MRPNILRKAIYSVLKEYMELAPTYNPPAELSSPPIEIDILRDIIRHKVELNTLAWEAIPVKTEHVLGQIKFFYPVPRAILTNEKPTTAVIRFKKDLNFCWRRFVIMKEMCHCLIDTDEDRVYDNKSLKRLLEGLASLINEPSSEDGPLMTEHAAEIMALEILLPLELRRFYIEDFRAGKISSTNLALRYRIPMEFVELSMYERYLDLSATIRGEDIFEMN